ncbi:MAG TPA: lipid II flippase MurJ, partial [Jatrophihabitantaceae bacterium]|nr:lipid II flippase MurJ [Jatrophihabitantaceae bacterium]
MTVAPTETDATHGLRDSGTAGDSITLAAWTLVSRATGVFKIAAIGAVLGPTFFGNAYQFTNALPNLIYFGFLAGSMFSSLLVPALVRHIDAGDREASERVVGGFLGLTLVALLAVLPLAILLGPLVLKVATLGGTASGG